MPKHSIHVAVVRLLDPIFGGVDPEPPDPADPESVAYWGYMINASWSVLAFASIVLMGLVGVSLKKLVSDSATVVALCVGLFAGFFCLTGCANAICRRYLILPDARRMAERGAHEAARATLRAALPPNSSLISQAAVGILAAVIFVVSV